MSGLIDWVDAAGRLWGYARRRLDLKCEPWPESVGARIQDGIPPESFRAQRFPEVFTGETLRFNLAVHALPELHRTCIYVHYVIPVPLARKLQVMHLNRSSYYELLSRSHRRIESLTESGFWRMKPANLREVSL